MLAYLVGLALRCVLMFAGGIGLLLSSAVAGGSGLVEGSGALMLLAYFGIEWFYTVLFEWLWNGQTPGKKALGLRVIKEGGFPIGIRDALLRNLLRAADLFPTLTLVFGVPLPSYLI